MTTIAEMIATNEPEIEALKKKIEAGLPYDEAEQAFNQIDLLRQEIRDAKHEQFYKFVDYQHEKTQIMQHHALKLFVVALLRQLFPQHTDEQIYALIYTLVDPTNEIKADKYL